MNHTNSIYIREFPRDYLVRENCNNHKIILHNSKTDIEEFNQYAKRSLELDNDAKRRSNDEAVSIHIITDKLDTRLNILYEAQICGFYGKPDCILRLGKDFYIMISITRAVQLNSIFNEKEAYRLIKKKIDGIFICSNNLDCLINDVIYNYRIQSIVHILSPNKFNAELCMNAYKKYCNIFPHKSKKIKVLISIINFSNDMIK